MKLALRTPSQNMLGARVYVYDDESVAVHRWDVTHDVQAGYIIRLPGTTGTAHPTVQLASNEVEIELSGEPFDWSGNVTTTTSS